MASDRDGHAGHAGQWVLVDARLQLLSVGEALYHGISPRTALDATARHVLIPSLRQATHTGQPHAASADYGGQSWQIRVRPVLGPVLAQPLAVLGCYAPQNATMPDPPQVGAWEWRVTPPGPDQQMRTFWSSELFDVYGLSRPTDTEARYWDGPHWIDELIVDSDRPETRRVLDRFLAMATDTLILHTYGVRNPSTGEHHRLRLAGRAYVTESGPATWFRGVSTRIDHLAETDPPAGTQDFLSAAFRLSADPLAAVDTTYEHLYMTSRAVGDLGIALPTHRHLPEMVHPDDLDTLRQFLADATNSSGGETGPVTIRFATGDGKTPAWRELDLVGTSVRLAAEDAAHHVLCRMTSTRSG